MHFKIHFSAQSIQGKREYNQDNFVAKQLTSDVYLFAVADGMGGTFGGEKASEIAVFQLENTINNNLDTIYDEEDGMVIILEKAVKNIQQEMARYIQENKEYSGMGTTLTALLCCENKFAYCNIGDSRIYEYESGNLAQLTSDHSYVQELIKKSDITLPPEFLKRHENVITRVLNGETDEADYFPSSDLKAGSIFILCSDGLILNKINDSHYIIQIIEKDNYDMNQACKSLINYAFNNGSTDNITCIIVWIEEISNNQETIQISSSQQENDDNYE